MFRRKAVAASAAILFCVANSATAAPLSADQILNQFNLVVFGDHQLNSQVHGRAFIGGDVTGAGQITTKNYVRPPSSFADVTVVGDVKGSVNVQDPVTVDVGGVVTGAINNNPNGVVNQNVAGLDAVASHFAATLKQASQDVAGLTANATTTAINVNQGVKFVGLTGELTVFSVMASDFIGNEIRIDLNGADAILINVAGANLSFGQNFNTDMDVGARVIWNFFEATTLNIGNRWVGSVLAPLATVSNGNNIHGALVAAAFNQGGQVHQQAWTGAIPTTEVTTPIPLPAAAWLLLGGMGLLAAMRRRAA